MSTDSLGNENIDMAVGYSNGYKQGFDDGKKDSVKHGHWKLSHSSSVCTNYVCSVCGNGFGTNSNMMPKFCSECGAKMDGDVNAAD